MGGEIVFLHLSDTHILADESELFGVRPDEESRRTLDHIATLPLAPRFCPSTGDLVQDGTVAGHAHLRQLLAPLTEQGLPVLVGLGNHDARAAFRRGFLSEHGDDDRRYCYAREHDGLRMIMLDSPVPGADHGEFGPEQLSWLARELREAAPRGTLIALHHPVALAGIPWLADDLLRDAEALRGVLHGHAVIGTLAGHCHTPSVATFAGTIAGVAEFVTRPGNGFNLCTIRDGVLPVTPISV